MGEVTLWSGQQVAYILFLYIPTHARYISVQDGVGPLQRLKML